MRIGIFIVIGAALIAASVAWIGRWEIFAQGGIVYRLDRWHGDIVACVLPADDQLKNLQYGFATKAHCEEPHVTPM
jgi:hypothetical protein